MTNTEKLCHNMIESGKLDAEVMRKNRCVLCSRLRQTRCVVLRKINTERNSKDFFTNSEKVIQ